jgi:arylsulfatase A-like enzyme
MYDGVNQFLEKHVDFRSRAPEFELLFDLAADPGERTNLAADPAHAAVLAELRAKVAAESVARNERRTAYVRTFPPAPRPKPAAPKAAK